jgi:hypothetical protein
MTNHRKIIALQDARRIAESLMGNPDGLVVVDLETRYLPSTASRGDPRPRNTPLPSGRMRRPEQTLRDCGEITKRP